MAERGGINLYEFVLNNPARNWDAHGTQAAPAPLLAPPPVTAPPITPKPGPPWVMLCTIEFCCVYVGTAYICDRTGFHEWMGSKICRAKEKGLEPWNPNERRHQKVAKKCVDDLKQMEEWLEEMGFPGLTEDQRQEFLTDCMKKFGIIYPWPPSKPS